MTIEALNVSSGPYYPNGSTTAFPFTFQVADDGEVAVEINGAVVSTSLYSVLLSGNGTGSVIFFTAPASGGELMIYSNPDFTQKTNFEDQGPYYQSALNSPIDRSAIRDLWLRDRSNRAFTVPRPGAQLEAVKGKYPVVLTDGTQGWSAGTTPNDLLRTELALRGAGQGGDLVGLRDSASPAGSLFTSLQGMVDKLRAATNGGGGGILPYGSDQAYPDGSVSNELVPRVTLAGLANVAPKTNKVAFVHDDGKEGHFKCFPGSPPVSDLWQGIYVVSNTAGFYWARLWNQKDARPEWFGVKANDSTAAAANVTKIAAAYAAVPHLQFGPFDYWHNDTIFFGIDHHKVSGCGEKYNDVFGAMTRFVCTSGSSYGMIVGPATQPGSINAMPQGIVVKDIMLGRSVAPVISSNCVGLYTRWVLNAIIENVKTDGSMVGFQEQGTVHTFKINCEAVRAVAGTGGGTDYFIGHYAYGGGSIGAAGGNASLYVVNCSAGCNYGPLQTASGSIGFKADQAFTDVWYWNPETTNFYIGQAVLGNDNTGTVFTNTDFIIDHPIHDQFKNAGLYVTDVATAGSVEIEKPYFGPSTSARACYWVNSSEGAVSCRGGQFVMGGAPAVQAILLMSSRGCDVLDYPIILEHGNTYPAVGVSDVSDARIEVFGKNPNVSGGALVQLAGTCANIQVHAKSSGKASAFQYGVQIIGAGVSRSTFDVSGFNSTNFPATNRQLDNNGTPITAAGTFGTTNVAQGNFN